MESTNQPTSQPPGEEVLDTHHVIVRKPYEAIKALAEYVESHSEEYLIGEHEPDEKKHRGKTTGCPVVHCHIMIYKMTVSVEALRKEIKKIPGMGRGQYAIMERTEKERRLYDKDKLCIYILKGAVETAKDYTFGYGIPNPSTNISQLEAWAEGWIMPDVDANGQMIPSNKEKRDTTIYDIAMKVYEIGNKEIKLGHHNELIHHFLPSIENWRIMCRELNQARIRTSRNELERAWVTILRQDDENCNSLFYSIQQNVFRNKT